MNNILWPPAILAALFAAPLPLLVAARGDEPEPPKTPPRAARSVHLGWQAPDTECFYLEAVVRKSTRGSYFMVCGWNTGYFGIQELANGKKVVLFSVWDPTRGDNPDNVPLEQRVEVLHRHPDVRIRRFGGEGTGGQCMQEFPWKVGQKLRLMIRGTPMDKKTAYAAHVYDPAAGQWRHLATFRTRTGGQPLRGLYSFVEDFLRNGESATIDRRAEFTNGWVRTTKGQWQPLTAARFTASNATWEARESIDAGVEAGVFFLATGGATQRSRAIGSMLTSAAPDQAAPPDDLPCK